MKIARSRPAVELDTRPLSAQLEEARAFFGDVSLPDFEEGENPYVDKDGMVEFIVGNGLEEDPAVVKKMLEIKKILIGMTSVVTDYINRYAAANGQHYKEDPELWQLAMSKLPLMGPSSISKQSYTRHLKGLSIAKEFVDFILDIVASEGTSALNSFNKFLEKQGEALEFGIENNDDAYSTVVIGVAIEVFLIGKEVVYVPKVKQYRVDFTRENTKWNFLCASAEFVDIDFDYLYAANVFDYESLEDPDIKKEFDAFLKGSRKAQIENSSTFFNQDFETQQQLAGV